MVRKMKYSKEFKEEALKLSDEIGLKKAAQQLGIQYYTGLIHRCRRPHGITKADTETQNRENLIKRNFTSASPLKKLLTDITEVQCTDGKLYVSPILDCFNGEIVELVIRDNMKKELCIDTVKQLTEKYGRLEGTILHSDSGCQYTIFAD